MKSITQVVQSLLKPYIDNHRQTFESNIAPVETDATSASRSYSIGQQLVLNDILYDVTASITAGDPLSTTGAGANISISDKISNKLNTLKFNKVALLMDSYGSTAGNASGETGTIGGYLESIAPGVYDPIVSVGNSVGNGGFLSSVTSFCSQSGFDGKKYGAFYFAIGRNEWSSTVTQINEQTALLVSYVREHFPNAKLYYSWIANGDNNSAHGTKTQQYDAYRRLKTAMENNGVPSIYGPECVLHNYNYMSSDGVHPTQNGKYALAWAIHSALNTGYYQTEYNDSYAFDIADYLVSGVTSSFKSSRYHCEMTDNKAILKVPAVHGIKLSAPITQSSYQSIDIADFSSCYQAIYFKNPTYEITLPFTLFVPNSDNLYTLLPGYVGLTPDGKVQLRDVNANAAIRALNTDVVFMVATGTLSVAAHMA